MKLVQEYLEKIRDKVYLTPLDDYLKNKDNYKNSITLIENIRFHPEEEKINDNKISEFENKLY